MWLHPSEHIGVIYELSAEYVQSILIQGRYAGLYRTDTGLYRTALFLLFLVINLCSILQIIYIYMLNCSCKAYNVMNADQSYTASNDTGKNSK